MRVDPVCGMEVEETRVPQNLRSEHLGHYFYFCSQECKDEFERNPQQYVSPPAACGPRIPMEYRTCPHHGTPGMSLLSPQ